jgi:hypothetical protein
VLGREGAAAATASRGVGVMEYEALAHQRVFVFECCAVQVQKAFRIDEDARTKLLEDLVAVAGLGIEAHGIGQAGATAALDAHTKTAVIERNAFLFKQLADFLGCGFGEVNRWSRWGLCTPLPPCFCVSVHSKSLKP